MIRISKKYKCYTAHRNLEAGIKCARIHGHTYFITFNMIFRTDDDIAMLFDDIDQKLEPLVKAFDHQFMLYSCDPLVKVLREANESFIVTEFTTSAENLARYFYNEAKSRINEIVSVSVKETESSNVTYYE